jgi:hypothetical protein
MKFYIAVDLQKPVKEIRVWLVGQILQPLGMKTYLNV